MISDFQQLTEKVSRLAELAQSLRRENADLRLTMTALAADNADLCRRMEAAHQRVSALLEKMPVPEPDEEAA